jgi:hypothetical protein
MSTVLKGAVVATLGSLLFALQPAAAADQSGCPVGESRTLDPLHREALGQPVVAGPIVVACVRRPHLGDRELIRGVA